MGKKISQRCVMMRVYKRKETLRLCERLSLGTKGEAKGGLISEKFSLIIKIYKKGAKSLSWALSTQREYA